MSKDRPGAAKLRVDRRRQKLAASGLKEVSSVIIPAHKEIELRTLAKSWTEAHLLMLKQPKT
jgi:hypothetical protein